MKSKFIDVKKILMIEDDIRSSSFDEILEDNGYSVVVIDNLLDATYELENNKQAYEIVILDLVLDASDLPENMHKHIEDGDLAGCIFFDEILSKLESFKEKTIFFTGREEYVGEFMPDWYEKNKHNVVSKTAFDYKDRILELLNKKSPQMASVASRRVTERIKMELLRKEAQIREQNEWVYKFIADLSHDMRTQLNSLIGMPNTILEDKELKRHMCKKTEGIIGLAFDSSHYLLRLVNDLLDYKTIMDSEIKLKMEEYKTEHLIMDVVLQNMMWFTDTDKNISFELCVGDNIPTKLEGDEPRIMRILSNIISNSAKYTDEGIVTLSVEVSDFIYDNQSIDVIFTISDTGRGMTEDEINELFTPLTRFVSEEEDTYGGLGLGMSIVETLLYAMKGKLEITSKPNEGTKTTIRINQIIASDEKLSVEKIDKMKLFPKSGHRKVWIEYEPMPYGKVLVVDDVKSNLLVAELHLSRYELQVDTASSGLNAIDKIRNGAEYDIIFMDHLMPPGINGIETFYILQELGCTAPIVAFTANAVGDMPEEFVRVGFKSFISKPIAGEASKLDRLLNKHVRDALSQEIKEERLRAIGKEETVSLINVDTAFLEVSKDIHHTLHKLEEIISNDKQLAINKTAYIELTHSLKSLLSNIYEEELSDDASYFCQALRTDGRNIVINEMPSFVNRVRDALKKYALETSDEFEDSALICELLSELGCACENNNRIDAVKALQKLDVVRYSAQTKELLNSIWQNFNVNDLASVVDSCRNYVLSLRKKIEEA